MVGVSEDAKRNHDTPSFFSFYFEMEVTMALLNLVAAVSFYCGYTNGKR